MRRLRIDLSGLSANSCARRAVFSHTHLTCSWGLHRDVALASIRLRSLDQRTSTSSLDLNEASITHQLQNTTCTELVNAATLRTLFVPTGLEYVIARCRHSARKALNTSAI